VNGGTPWQRDTIQRQFQLNTQDLHTVADIALGGLPGGWIAMAGNPHGRKCVEAVFPNARIVWRDHHPDSIRPADWYEFSLNLPCVANATRHKLPEHLLTLPDRDLSKCSSDALAFLLAMAARAQGARVALYREGKLEIFSPNAGASALH
jgi:hypothetical protein